MFNKQLCFQSSNVVLQTSKSGTDFQANTSEVLIIFQIQ
jgi:hypothetical protein